MTARQQKDDVGRIRTCAPEGTSFLGLRDNHSATTPDGVLYDWLLTNDGRLTIRMKYKLC
jgi:hypothetical protein